MNERKHDKFSHYWQCTRNHSVTGITIAVHRLALKGLSMDLICEIRTLRGQRKGQIKDEFNAALLF